MENNQNQQLQQVNQTSLMHSGITTEQFLAAVNPKTVTDIIQSKNPSVIRVVKENGEQIAISMMRTLIVDVVKFFNLGKSMGASQVHQTAELILEAYGQYKFDDWKLCFKMAKLGQFGTVYDRIDGNVIFDWFDKYLEIRFSEFETARAKENRMLNEPVKSDPTPMPDYIKELIEKKVVVKEPERQLNQTDEQKQINKWISEFDDMWRMQGAADGKRFVIIGEQWMDVGEWLTYKAGLTK